MARYADNGIDRGGGLFGGAWINVILGLLVAAVPFLTAETGTAFWNNVVVGLLIALFAGYNAWAARNARGTAAWVAGVNVILGLWLVASPFIFAVGEVHFWSDVILGGLIAMIAAFNSWAAATSGRRYAGRPGI